MLPPPAGVIKLDQNEVPIPPPRHVIEAAEAALAVANWYQPAALYEEVKTLYAEYAGVNPSHVYIFPGADNFFDYIILKATRIATPRPTYFLLEEQATYYGAELAQSPLAAPTFHLDIADFLDKAKKADAIYIDNPNNPTGQLLLTRREVEEILALGKPTVVDEAYFEFSNHTVADMVETWPNLAVVRTMSKAFLLAGMRITPVLLGKLYKIHTNTVRFRVSLPSLAAARAALYKKDYVQEVVHKIRQGRQILEEGLKKLGIETWPTHANFMLTRGPPGFPKTLRRMGVWVRDEESRLGPGYARITIPPPEIAPQVVKTAAAIIEDKPHHKI